MHKEKMHQEELHKDNAIEIALRLVRFVIKAFLRVFLRLFASSRLTR